MQKDLFGIFQPIDSADIDSLPDPSLRNWAQKRLRDGVLNSILSELVKSGAVGNTREALKLLSSRSAATLPEKKSIITLTDLGLRPVKKFNIGTRRFCQNGKANLHSYLGVLSHALMACLCGSQDFNSGVSHLQLPLFDYKHKEVEQMELRGLKEIFRPNGGTDDIVRVAKDIWSKMSETIGTPDFVEGYYRSMRYLEDLLDLSQAFSGILVKPDFYKADLFERWLWMNAMLAWANVFINLAEGNLLRPTVHEIQVLDRGLGISGGRIDGVEILSEDKVFSGLVSGAKFASIGHLANYLYDKPQIGGVLRIIDWKFAIGDSDKNNGQFQKPICPEDVAECPIERHRQQVERYLTLGFLDEQFARKSELSTDKDFWDRRTVIKEGLVVYLFPTVSPVIHRVTLNAEERRKVFVRDVVSRWEEAGPRASIRKIDRQCRSLFSSYLSSNTEVKAGIGDRVNRPDLIGKDADCPVPIEKIIDSHRVFLDGHNIIEDRNGKHVLHLERLVACIESGAVKVSSSFGLPRGGLVCCPVHEDKNPSLSVRPVDGFFYCFARSCKISGRLSLGSIPKEVQVVINPESWVKRKDLFKDLFVPDEHHNILEQAQKALQEQFYESNGERYVKEERCLDSDLAYEMGAGFGTSDVISALLDQGISLEELKQAGLVRFSSKVSSQRGLFQLLRHKGLRLSEIKREVGKTADGKPIYGLPYFVLDGRVTFPLKVRGRYANMYGRAVYPNAKVPHVKLSTEDSGIRHGAFNEDILYLDKCKEVVVTEGVFDAISIKRMFLRDSLAVIGTKNNLIVELVAQSGKDVAIALDNDQGGRTDTERLKKLLLQDRNFKGRVRDFTQSFISGLYGREFEARYSGSFDWRDQLDWDDWNTLLIKHGKWLS